MQNLVERAQSFWLKKRSLPVANIGLELEALSIPIWVRQFTKPCATPLSGFGDMPAREGGTNAQKETVYAYNTRGIATELAMWFK